ncbi:MAG: D-cysteine desulfhydrase family protein [Deltaproteobacteria bacterium]|nr:D-cysteine desulfhydrase family protein [Deltaproteobacteria bacterium]
MAFVFPERKPIGRLPTPIQKLSRLSELLGGPELYVKRDDLSGMAVSGNKVRKLEFTAGRALAEGCDLLITCGGIQSNHARATAAVAAHLGLKSHLVLVGQASDAPNGNLLLDLLLGAEISYLPGREIDELNDYMNQLASDYRKQGLRPFVVPLGASDATGALGYALEAQEMASQVREMGLRPDYIVLASGSGGTQAGLIIGQELFGLPGQIVGINVRCDEAYFKREISLIFDQFRQLYQPDLKAGQGAVQIIDGYVGQGYAKSTPQEMRFIAQVAQTEGLFMDPVYTGKAFHGLYQEIQKGTLTKGQQVIFIHTGGLFGLFPWGAEFSKEIFDQVQDRT